MKLLETSIPDLFLLEPKVFGDQRGFFMESYNEKMFADLGIQQTFVQDNHSRSPRNVLRGLHYQVENAQGKLVRVTAGEVFDVAVDLRKSSPTFGQWFGTILSESNKRLLWVPAGFAHGFLVLSETADFLYKTTDFYNPSAERCILWNDPDLQIRWPIEGTPLLSPKDEKGLLFKSAPYFS